MPQMVRNVVLDGKVAPKRAQVLTVPQAYLAPALQAIHAERVAGTDEPPITAHHAHDLVQAAFELNVDSLNKIRETFLGTQIPLTPNKHGQYEIEFNEHFGDVGAVRARLDEAGVPQKWEEMSLYPVERPVGR